jgi:hypothetical protein
MHFTVAIIHLLSAANLSTAAGDNPNPVLSCMLVMAKETGVCAPLAMGAGVLDLVAGALRLWAMWLLTRCPAANALHNDNSPANTAAATILASLRALSPGFVGCEPRTPRRSSIAACGSRIVPPPNVPTSIDGIETLICSDPRRL